METNFPQARRDLVLLFMLGCLALALFAAVVFRVENPSIVQREEQRQMPGGGADMGEMGKISAMMQKLRENPEDTDSMRALGMAFMDMRAWDKALSFWEMLLKREPRDVMALNQKGFCFFELEKYPEAAALFEAMLGIEPTNHHAHFNLGIIYKYYLKKEDEAGQHFQAVLDAAPDDPELLESARKELATR